MAVQTIVIGLVIFSAGATAGLIAVVSAGIRREEREFSLTRQAPGRASQGSRLLTGLYVRQRTDLTDNPADRPDMYA